MKKILIAILCLCFALSLVACSELEDYYDAPQMSMEPPTIDATPGIDEGGVSHKHLERLGKDNAWIPVDDSETVFDNGVLWEPGYVQMRLLRVVRKLDGTIKYKINMVADGELGGLAEYIDVLVMPGLEQLPEPTLEATEGWVYLSPLDVLLSGDSTVSQGQIFAEDDPAYVSFGIALRVRVDAEAGLELGAKLDLHVEIEYEKFETDSFDSGYDDDVGATEEPAHSKDDQGKGDNPEETPHYTVDQGGALPNLPDKDHTDKENAKDPVDTTTDYNGDGVIDENDWGIVGDDGKKDPTNNGAAGAIVTDRPLP